MILLLVEADTAETVAASKAVFAELALTAVGAILTVVRHVTVGTVDTFRTPFAADAEGEPAAADALAGVAGVVHVLGVEDAEAVVAIFRSDRLGIVTVLRAILNQVVAGFTQKKPLKFLNEVHIILER